MASERNRILDIINYLESLGVKVNLSKNKAQGNKGFFKAVGNSYRIDISKKLNQDEILGVLSHEFAHYVHYKYDKNLKSLSFVFENLDETILNEMINIYNNFQLFLEKMNFGV